MPISGGMLKHTRATASLSFVDFASFPPPDAPLSHGVKGGVTSETLLGSSKTWPLILPLLRVRKRVNLVASRTHHRRRALGAPLALARSAFAAREMPPSPLPPPPPPAVGETGKPTWLCRKQTRKIRRRTTAATEGGSRKQEEPGGQA